MAYYAALVSLVQLLEDIVLRDRYQKLLLDRQQLASVYEKFSLLQILLDDYSPNDREAADSVERRIRDAAYQAQDMLDSYISNPPSWFDWLEFDFREKVRRRVEKVNEETGSVVEELMGIKKSHTTEDLQLNYSAHGGTSNQASGMEGFEERLTMIKDQLCGEPSKLRVVSIVGMGGIGKTTLARNIFCDELIVYKFDCRSWVTISQNYHLQKVLLNILDSMNVHIDKLSGVEELAEKIYKHLKGRRYLVIMDDMWDTKVWDDVKRILPDDSNGSRIMITTRISDVALYADRFGFYHQVQFLNEDQSWNLFRTKVLCPSELEDIGRLIANNCHGLPLAIVVVAGLLTKVNKTRCDWGEIARNVSLAAAENDERFSMLLSLSYNHLPHHLKPCLLYIGGFFPEDNDIPVSKLVKLWVAEGFLKPVESKSLEVVAEEYLEDLVNRNLILITKKRSNGKIKWCGIHDVLRDLCIEIISHENFLHVLDSNYYFHPTPLWNVRRLYIRSYSSFLSRFITSEAFHSHDPPIIDYDTFHLKFLFFEPGFKVRAMDATEQRIPRFDIPLSNFFHLRHLIITQHIPNIPPLIVELQNLQTLIVELYSIFGNGLCSLPFEILAMPNLRHIMSSKNLHFQCQFFSETTVPNSSFLKNLQTLSYVENVTFTNGIIETIPNLRKLKVLCYEKEAIVWQKFHLDNLFHLCHLESLNLGFLNIKTYGVSPPESFAFPLTLKKLSLTNCRLPWGDMAMVGSLRNLQLLKLRNSAFVGEKWETTEGEFPQLKFLLMEELELMHWETENTHFPTLQHLRITTCKNLKKIPPEVGDISTLELVEVNYSELAAKSAMKLQEEQRDMGNDVLQVQVYPQYRNFSEEEASENEDEIQEEASECEKEIQEAASESNDDIQEEDGSKSREEIQEINPVNELKGEVNNTSKWA